MNTRLEPDETIFAQAIALSGALRSAYLDQACGADRALRAAVDELLRAHDGDAGFMGRPAVEGRTDLAAVARASRLTETIGDRIGRYKLLQKIGEGGCGVVYMAEQEEPVRRRVALKVIKLGMDTDEVIARFEVERQALALMDHPNIARVLDAGATDAGRPFFVMELVRGTKITAYCDEHNLPTVDRLKLFAQVCHAVQHAHQKGIIHRDLKPSNILVTLHDGAPLPKVIDFGVAKATQGRLTDRTLFTAFEQFIGTPAYMSPEQAQLSTDVDTRSDIYSLGVLLYEILTGCMPFEVEPLMQVGLAAMRRQVCEVDPLRPSARLRALDAVTLTTTAQHRHIEAPKLIRLVDGDLDWIVMRCLEKDRTRRYETAISLAQDLQRHLQNEPVVARVPTRSYRFRKMVRRHHVAFGLGGALVTGLIVGLAVATWQAVRATRAEAEAMAAATKRGKVAGFLEGIFSTIAPAVFKGEDTRLLKQMLDEAAKRVPLELRGEPAEQDELHVTLGWAYYGIGEYAPAEASFRAAVDLARARLAPGHATIANRLKLLGIAVLDGGDPVRSQPYLDEALAILRALGAEQDYERIDTLRVLASAQQKRGHYRAAAATGREMVAGQRTFLGAEHATLSRTLLTFAPYEDQVGNLARSELMQREALAISRKLSRTSGFNIEPLIQVAKCAIDHGASAEADALLREATSLLRAQTGLTAVRQWSMLGALANGWLQRRDLTQAQALAREQLAVAQREFSPNHSFVAASHATLASVLQQDGNLAAAETECRKALAMIEHTFGRKGARFATTLEQLAAILQDLGRYDEAESLCRDALAARLETVGENNAYLMRSLQVLARVQAARGNVAGAVATREEYIHICREHLGPDHPLLVPMLVSLADHRAKERNFAAAETALTDAWRIEQGLGYARIEQQRLLRSSYAQLYSSWAATAPDKAALATEWAQNRDQFNAAMPAMAPRL